MALTTTLGIVTDLAVHNRSGLIVSAVSRTIGSIINVLSYMKSSNSECADDLLKKVQHIDLEFTVRIIQMLIEEENKKISCPVVLSALEGLNEVLVRINIDLETLREAIAYHQTKWFAAWRQFSWSGNIETI